MGQHEHPEQHPASTLPAPVQDWAQPRCGTDNSSLQLPWGHPLGLGDTAEECELGKVAGGHGPGN